MTTSTSLRRTLGLAAAGAVAIATLSGCLSFTADLTVASDATASGTLALGVDKQAASLLGLSDLGTFESGIADQGADAGTGDLLSTGDCTARETDSEFLYECAFSGEAFTSADNPWTIAKDGENIVFTMKNTMEGGDSGELLGDASLGELNVSVTFPGAILTITGDGVTKTSDTTATVVASLSAPLDVVITSESTGGGGGLLRTLLIIGGILLLIIIIAVVVFAIMRRGKPVAPAAAVVVADTPVEQPPVAPTVDDVVAEETVIETPVAEETVIEETVIEETVVEETPDEDRPPTTG